MKDQPMSLDIIDVASHCTADWDKMRGTDQVRHCSQCQSNVYHLSNMSRDEAEALVREHEGQICVRLYRRADGTILTRDCPIGLRAIRRQLARLVAGLAAMIALLVGGLIFCVSSSVAKTRVRDEPHDIFTKHTFKFRRPIDKWTKWVDPKRGVVMGSATVRKKIAPNFNLSPSKRSPTSSTVSQ